MAEAEEGCSASLPCGVQENKLNLSSAEKKFTVAVVHSVHSEEEQESKHQENQKDSEKNLEKDEDGGEKTNTMSYFTEVFGNKLSFDSWAEFTELFDEFQLKSGSVFKPRNAVMAAYANEKRVTEQIPERFVYSNLRMVCIHFGLPSRKGDKPPAAGKKYIGLNCEAGINIGYRRGKLCIGRMNLVHRNHTLKPGQIPKYRKVRSFGYTDESDMLFCKAAVDVNPFEFGEGNDTGWKQAADILREQNKQLSTLTPVLVRRRINFLIDRFQANCKGRAPSPSDEMGMLLDELGRHREEMKEKDAPPPRKRGRKPKSAKLKASADEDFESKDSEAKYTDTSVQNNCRDNSFKTALRGSRSKVKTVSKTSINKKSSGTKGVRSDVSLLLDTFKNKDIEERRLRADEIKRRRDELAVRQKEIEMQQKHFEAQLGVLSSLKTH